MGVQSQAATSREAIVAAAIRLADEEGLDAVSMRRLAERLGVGTMTPYTYVANKEELVELMGDEVAQGMLVPEPLPEHWRDALRQIALRSRDTFEAHPWVVGNRPRGSRLRINIARHIEQSASVVVGLGGDLELGRAALGAVDDYVIGHCLRQVWRKRLIRDRRAQAAAAGGNGHGPELDPEVEAAIESGELARLGRIIEMPSFKKGFGPPEPDFEQGLEWLLDGIESAAPAPDSAGARR